LGRQVRQIRRGLEHTQAMKILLANPANAGILYYTRSKKARQEVWQLAKRHKLGMGSVFTFIKDYFWGK